MDQMTMDFLKQHEGLFPDTKDKQKNCNQTK